MLNSFRLQSKIILGHMNSIGENSSIQYFRSGHYFLDIQYIFIWYFENSINGARNLLELSLEKHLSYPLFIFAKYLASTKFMKKNDVIFKYSNILILQFEFSNIFCFQSIQWLLWRILMVTNFAYVVSYILYVQEVVTLER